MKLIIGCASAMFLTLCVVVGLVHVTQLVASEIGWKRTMLGLSVVILITLSIIGLVWAGPV